MCHRVLETCPVCACRIDDNSKVDPCGPARRGETCDVLRAFYLPAERGRDWSCPNEECIEHEEARRVTALLRERIERGSTDARWEDLDSITLSLDPRQFNRDRVLGIVSRYQMDCQAMDEDVESPTRRFGTGGAREQELAANNDDDDDDNDDNMDCDDDGQYPPPPHSPAAATRPRRQKKPRQLYTQMEVDLITQLGDQGDVSWRQVAAQHFPSRNENDLRSKYYHIKKAREAAVGAGAGASAAAEARAAVEAEAEAEMAEE